MAQGQKPSSRTSKEGEGVQEGSVGPAGRKTLETLGAADNMTEALEMAANEQRRHEVIHTISFLAYVFIILLSSVFHCMSSFM